MKKRYLFISTLMMLTLASCNALPSTGGNKVPNPDNSNGQDSQNNSNTHQHTFSSKWSSDDFYHWHEATCEHTGEVSFKSEHKFGDWIIDRKPTMVNVGFKHKVCSTCGYDLHEAISVLEGDGFSLEHPLNVEDFIAECKSLEINTPSDNQYYVKGIVKDCSKNETYNSFSFTFDGYENLEEDASAKVYSCVIDESLGTYSETDLEGKEIVVYGYLYKYYKINSNYAYEVAYLNAKQSPTGVATSPVILDIHEPGSSTQVHQHTYSDVYSYDENYHWYEATCEHTSLFRNKSPHTLGRWITTKEPTATTEGSKVRFCNSCNYEEREVIPVITKATGTFTVWSFNDFHGAVKEYSSDGHVGLAKFGTFLKQVSDEENTIIIDSGDTFQGSIESNHNNGAMITDVFNYAHVDVHTLGNHDFDWGEDKIENNKARVADDGWRMTNLASNIYDYDFSSHTEGVLQQDRLGESYYIKTLENGVKIGVVGVIGADQITSICSPLVEDICFKNEIENVKTVSNKLKTELNCDFVIASVHGSAADTKGLGLTDVSPISGRKYVDYVVCGHSHQYEDYTENGVRYTQAQAYGERIFRATFTLLDGELKQTDVGGLNYAGITAQVKTVDSNITNIMASYEKEYSSIGGQVLGSGSGTFSKTNQLPNLLCKAVYEEAKAEGYDVDIACSNNARYDIRASGNITYSQFYEAFPFDNVIYIVKVTGSKNVAEVCYDGNYCYHDPSLTSMSSSKTYTIAVIDYLLWHTNSNRYYDYFSHSGSNMQILGTLKKDGNAYLYRDIAADYFKKQSGTVIASNYNSSNAGFVKPTY
ncbi:MAG: 5'-nucleotidase C-terminal domain-containing protein [Bacilli bacterium]|nr:5'-nucleotidase C-terminal domain-containing protein [Bacilli bacterium]